MSDYPPVNVLQPTAYEPFRSVRATADMDDRKQPFGPDNDKNTLLASAGPSSGELPSRGGIQRMNAYRAASDRFSVVRLVVRLLAFLLAASVLGIQAYQFSLYQRTRLHTFVSYRTNLRTRLWPLMNIEPVYIILGVSLLAVVLNLLALVLLCFSRIHQSAARAWAVYLSSLVIIVAWIVALVYLKLQHWRGSQSNSWDIWAWTCQRKDAVSTIPWKTLCIGNKYTFAAGIAAGACQLLNLVLFGLSQHSLQRVRALQSVQKGYRRIIKV